MLITCTSISALFGCCHFFLLRLRKRSSSCPHSCASRQQPCVSRCNHSAWTPSSHSPVYRGQPSSKGQSQPSRGVEKSPKRLCEQCRLLSHFPSYQLKYIGPNVGLVASEMSSSVILIWLCPVHVSFISVENSPNVRLWVWRSREP